MAYREHPPPPALRPWLDCLWERWGDSGAPVRVLPDGCIDVVWTSGSGTQLVGANTTAFLVPERARRRVVGARMLPGAAPALLALSAELVLNARPPIDQVLGDGGARLALSLDRSSDPVLTLASWLEDRAASAKPPDPLVTAAVRRLSRSADGVAGVAQELAISERGLRRRVTVAVGYGPKRLGRVLRLIRAIGAARDGESLSRAAYDAGYADQAHFANDCRELAGVSASVLLAE